MEKRYLLFFALALPIYIATMAFVQKQQKDRKAYDESVAPAVTEWSEQDQDRPVPPPPAADASEIRPAEGKLLPESMTATTPVQVRVVVEPETIRTKSYEIDISPAGAVPVRWDIIDPRWINGGATSEASGEGDPGEASAERKSVALIDPNLDAAGLDRPLEIVLRELNARFYNEINSMIYRAERIDAGEEAIGIRFESDLTDSGLRIRKTYVFPMEGFESSLRIELINEGQSRLSFNNQGHGFGLAMGPGLGVGPVEKVAGFASRYTYTDSLYYTSEGVETVRVRKPDEGKTFVKPAGTIRWAGIHNRYFAMIALPDSITRAGEGFGAGKVQINPRVVSSGYAPEHAWPFYPSLELFGAPFEIDPGQSVEFGYTIFAGPKEKRVLEKTPELELGRVLFFDSWNWMRSLCFLLMWMLNSFFGLTSSWGVSIIALVITVRLATFPVSQIGLKHQARMMAQQAKLKPYLDKINEKYKSNPSKKNQEVMKLYREHNVNPLGMFKGCLWMLIQLPIFFALYRLLSQSIELRGASFLWIRDLSAPDQLFSLGFSLPLMGSYFNLLPVLTAATQVVLGKLSSNPNTAADPTQAAMQKQMMYMMPVMILVMTYSFPSGLVLYWFVSNLWQLFQQQFVNKKILHPPTEVATAT